MSGPIFVHLCLARICPKTTLSPQTSPPATHACHCDPLPFAWMSVSSLHGGHFGLAALTSNEWLHPVCRVTRNAVPGSGAGSFAAQNNCSTNGTFTPQLGFFVPPGSAATASSLQSHSNINGMVGKRNDLGKICC